MRTEQDNICKVVYFCSILISRFMQNSTTQWRRATQFFLEKYTSHFIWKVVCERELETEQNYNILTATLMVISVVSFSFSRVAQPEAWGPSFLLSAGFLCHILSPTRLISKLTDFLSPPSFIIVQRPLLLVGVTIALIQPIHGQGYNILIDRMHLLFIKVHFLFWQPGRVVGQYTTLQPNTSKW